MNLNKLQAKNISKKFLLAFLQEFVKIFWKALCQFSTSIHFFHHSLAILSIMFFKYLPYSLPRYILRSPKKANKYSLLHSGEIFGIIYVSTTGHLLNQCLEIFLQYSWRNHAINFRNIYEKFEHYSKSTQIVEYFNAPYAKQRNYVKSPQLGILYNWIGLFKFPHIVLSICRYFPPELDIYLEILLNRLNFDYFLFVVN